jgi:hypothetical protein
MATVQNISRVPVVLTGGRTLEPNATATANPNAENEAAWIEAGYLTVVSDSPPPPVDPSLSRIPVFGGTGTPGEPLALVVQLTDDGDFSDLVVVT